MLIICLPIPYQWKNMEDHLCLFLSSFVSTTCVQSLKVRILTFWSHLSRPRPSAKEITSTLESASPLLIPSSIFNQSGVVPCWQVIIVVPLKISSRLLNLSQSFQEEHGVLSPRSRQVIFETLLFYRLCSIHRRPWRPSRSCIPSVQVVLSFSISVKFCSCLRDLPLYLSGGWLLMIWRQHHHPYLSWIRRIVCINLCFLTEFHELFLSIPSVCFGSWVAWFSYSCAE